MLGRRATGSESELQRVYCEQVRAVYAFFAYSVDPPTAEDLTAATFERVVRSWDRFDSRRGSQRTWVLSIARNLLTDHFRSQKRRRALSTDEHPGLLEDLIDQDHPLDQLLDSAELARLLRPLSQRDRMVLALRYGADLETREIARVLELTPANVQQIVSRSLQRLRKLVESAELEVAAEPAVGPPLHPLGSRETPHLQ